MVYSYILKSSFSSLFAKKICNTFGLTFGSNLVIVDANYVFSEEGIDYLFVSPCLGTRNGSSLGEFNKY